MFILKNTVTEGINKWRDLADAKETLAETKCSTLEVAANTAESNYEYASAVCEVACVVYFPTGTVPSCIPCQTKVLVANTYWTVAKIKHDVCEKGALAALKLAQDAVKLKLWIAQFAVKVA